MPDFRKLADETHNRLCARIFQHVCPLTAHLPSDWLASARSPRRTPSDGDIDTLMAAPRRWSAGVVLHRRPRRLGVVIRCNWQKAMHARSRTELSDVLHERLTVPLRSDRRAAHLMRRLESGRGRNAALRRHPPAARWWSKATVSGGSLASDFSDPDTVGDERKLVGAPPAARSCGEIPRRVALVDAAPDDAFSLSEDHQAILEEAPVARLERGDGALRPRVRVLDSEFLDGAQRERIRARLQRFVDDRIQADLAPLFQAVQHAAADPTLRGPVHRLQEAIGLMPVLDEDTLGAGAARAAARLGCAGWPVRAVHARAAEAPVRPRCGQGCGRCSTVCRCQSCRKSGAITLRAAPGLAGRVRPRDGLGQGRTGAASPRHRGAHRRRTLLDDPQVAPMAPRAGLAMRLSIKADLLPGAVPLCSGFLGGAERRTGAGGDGLLAPAMLHPLRRRRPAIPEPAVAEVRHHGPFAALAALKR